ncbi:hypothetical protein A2U01_0089147, partial [Trifolium medium]|nr:hypothetical protein [Trifolium medium]
GTEGVDDMDIQVERKRRREATQSFRPVLNGGNNNEQVITDGDKHFLSARPGTQACRDQ